MPEKVTLADCLRRSIDARLFDVKKIEVAQVLRFNTPAGGPATVDVQPMINPPAPTADGDPLEWETPPQVAEVPILWPRGGGFFISFPIAVGDFVLLLYCDRDISTWRATGQQSNANDVRTHSGSFPFAYPGGFPDTAPVADVSATDLVIGKDGSTEQIHVTATDIKLGKGATDYVALASKVDAALTTLATAIGGCQSGTQVAPTVSSVAATITKAL